MKFAKPAAPSGLKFDDLDKSLLLIWAHSVEKDVSTVHGPKDAVSADVHVLTGEHAGEVFRKTLIFPAVLQLQLGGSIGSGDPVLGRLGKGLAKKGQSAPWILEDPTEADEEVAAAYVKTLGVSDGGPIGTGGLETNGEAPPAGDDEPPW